MIFTPEESREIAVEMLGWACISSGTLRWLEPPDQEHVYVVDGSDLPDFSLPEWTGPMIEGIHRVCNEKRWANIDIRRLTVDAYRPGRSQRCNMFLNNNLNRNLYDAWKWLRGKKEAPHV